MTTSAAFRVEGEAGGRPVVRLTGRWTLAALGRQLKTLETRLAQLGRRPEVEWDLTGVEAIDSFGGTLLWRTWGQRMPERITADEAQRVVLERIAALRAERPPRPWPRSPLEWVIKLGGSAIGFARQAVDLATLLGQVALDGLHLFRHPGDIPWREISANIYKSGVRAMPVTALVGFLIGVVLSYLSALQLRNFGADVFIINILGIGITRELGPVLVAVLVAGRSGSAMTAQLGTMRVTEEIDALATMGVSRSLRLVFPKVAALSLVMPLLVLWATAIALAGGMVSAQLQLDISYGSFIEALPKVVPVANLWIGLTKGWVYGVLVALVACHFGLRVRPNTESLSANTTSSVVTAITGVILVNAIFAIAVRDIGVPTS